MSRIDTHFHMLPPFWTEALIKKVGKPTWGVPDWSFETAMAVMDRLQTGTAMISLATPSVSVWEGQEQLDITKRVNDFGLDLVARANGRLGYFATLPMPNVEYTVAEIGRAYDDYQADGVILISSYKGVYLGDKSFDAVWAELNKHKAVVFIHPGIPELKPLEGVPQPTVDFPMDTTRCALSLVTGGVLERYPDVKIILSHAGGFLPFAALRFAVLLHDYTLKQTSEEDITKLLKLFYFDTALSSPDALPSLMSFAAPGHVIFGSDNPYISADQQAMFTSEQDKWTGFTTEQLHQVNRGNAEVLFPRLKGK